ncbi:hypothetical protein B484DRAFT_444809, partial [Ochromonadaceae sp. CCMP2298]
MGMGMGLCLHMCQGRDWFPGPGIKPSRSLSRRFRWRSRGRSCSRLRGRGGVPPSPPAMIATMRTAMVRTAGTAGTAEIRTGPRVRRGRGMGRGTRGTGGTGVTAVGGSWWTAGSMTRIRGGMTGTGGAMGTKETGATGAVRLAWLGGSSAIWWRQGRQW